MDTNNFQQDSSGYGKRPLWQWILIYLVIGAIVYGAVYYFVWGKGGYRSNYNYAPTDENAADQNAY